VRGPERRPGRFKRGEAYVGDKIASQGALRNRAGLTPAASQPPLCDYAERRFTWLPIHGGAQLRTMAVRNRQRFRRVAAASSPAPSPLRGEGELHAPGGASHGRQPPSLAGQRLENDFAQLQLPPMQVSPAAGRILCNPLALILRRMLDIPRPSSIPIRAAPCGAGFVRQLRPLSTVLRVNIGARVSLRRPVGGACSAQDCGPPRGVRH